MADDTEQVSIEFNAVDNMSSTLKGMQGTLNDFESGIKSVAAVFVTGAMAEAIKYFIQQALEAEATTLRMDSAFKRLGDTNEILAKQYGAVFSTMSSMDGFLKVKT